MARPWPVLFASSVLAACSGRSSPVPTAGGDAERGFVLLRERGCTHCHAGTLAGEPAPLLERVGARRTPQAIEAALTGSARMPDCLAGLGEKEQRVAREALVHHLAARGGLLERPQASFEALALERGRQLFHSVGCVACHEPFERPETLARPLWDFPEVFEARPEPQEPKTARDSRSLRGIGARTSHAALVETLRDPLSVWPSGRMPSLALDAGEAADLAAYLLYEDGVDRGAVLTRAAGLLLHVYQADFSGETADFDALVPVRREVAASFFEGLSRPDDDFGLRLRGLLEVGTSGLHRFWTRSDDGSMLYVDGALVVDNRGQHGMDERAGELFLAAGAHALEVTYFEHLGDAGLEVAWEGPGFAREPLGFERLSHLVCVLDSPAEAFEVDADLAARGGELYRELGCAACHDPDGAEPAAPALVQMSEPRGGCLSERPGFARPYYAFDAGERADLAAALRAGEPPAQSAEQRLASELTRLDCGACHSRGELSGPGDERRPYFQVAHGLDLGDQGRLPPSLARAGAKLKPAWLTEVLTGEGRARPYMKTRMPQYGAANVAELPVLFAAADAALRDEREPEFSLEAVDAGRALAGTRGLGCIQCHEFAGHPSLGIPAVDLAHVHERTWPGWFRELLMDPIALDMNTRMPTFWNDGKSPVALLDGDPARQVDALWSYLSLGSSMPLPEGLVPLPNEYEVEVTDRPVCVGVFMAGVSPRTVCVGLPERVHYAFDVQNSRLALAWRGRFLDARGTWHGRAGELEKPAGEDVLEFAPGNALMMLDERDDPWPTEIGRAAGYRVLGRSLDHEGRPAFEYVVCGVEVRETIAPVIRPGGGRLRREFSIPMEQIGENLFLRVAVGDSIQPVDEETWLIRGDREIRARIPGETEFVHTDESGRMELRLPITEKTAHTTRSARWCIYQVEYSW